MRVSVWHVFVNSCIWSDSIAWDKNDTIGCFSTNAKDANLVMEIMSGIDKNDMTTLPDFWQENKVKFDKKKIGIIKQFMSEGVDSQVRQLTLDYVKKLKKLGYEVEEVDLMMSKYSLGMYYIVVPAEVMSNLARYDGIRYGYRSDEAKTLDEIYGNIS